MNCFGHAAAPAAGTCKACAKGICKQCTRVEESGLYCSKKCAATGADAYAMHLRALKIYGIGDSKPPGFGPGVVIYGGLGLVFLPFGLLPLVQHKPFDRGDWFAVVLGAAMLFADAYLRVRQNKLGLNY